MSRRGSIVLASGNRGKLAEFAELLAPYDVELVPLSAFTDERAEETGASFRDNALLKARHAVRLSGLPAIADDSGLEVDALNGAPGVLSARYAGLGATDLENNRKLLGMLADASMRSARFRCVLAYVRDAGTQPLFAEGAWEGSILREQQGTGGFGYDPLFLPQGEVDSAAQLEPDAKNLLSHRGRAARELLRLLLDAGELRERM